jgi:hypothetical protein
MPLADRPDFQAWLARFEERHERLHGRVAASPSGRCDGCGGPGPDGPTRTGLCQICLAEQYGRERSAAAARVAGALRVALARDEGTPIDEIRAAVEEVLDEHEPATG